MGMNVVSTTEAEIPLAAIAVKSGEPLLRSCETSCEAIVDAGKGEVGSAASVMNAYTEPAANVIWHDEWDEK